MAATQMEMTLTRLIGKTAFVTGTSAASDVPVPVPMPWPLRQPAPFRVRQAAPTQTG